MAATTGADVLGTAVTTAVVVRATGAATAIGADTGVGATLDLLAIANDDATAAATSGVVVVPGTGTIPEATISLVEIASPPRRFLFGSALTMVANDEGAEDEGFFILSFNGFIGILGADYDP